MLGITAYFYVSYTSDALKGRRLYTWNGYAVREKSSTDKDFQLVPIKFEQRRVTTELLWMADVNFLSGRDQPLPLNR